MRSILLEIPELFGFGIEVYFIVFILATPFFFLWRRLFRKILLSKTAITIASWLSAFVSAPFAYVALITLWIAIVSYYPSNGFNQSAWFADKEKRYELAEDIIESRMLIGRSKAEVKQLLGDEGNDESNDDWRYYLGFKPSLFGIDPDVLDVHFQDGKVDKVGQHET